MPGLEERAHAVNGPSSLSRRLACPGSRAAEEGIPESPESDKAAEGTRAHELLERLLKGGNPIGDEPPEMVQHIMTVVRWVQEKQALGYGLHVEVKVDPVELLGPDTWGTSDIVLRKDEHIIVADLKYGHHEVHAIGNPQLVAYAAGALRLFEDTGLVEGLPEVHFTLAILQPRLFTGAPVKTTDVSLDALIATCDQINLSLSSAKDDDLVPSGDACKFCRAKLTCVARGNAMATVSASAFVAAGVGIVSDNPQAITSPSTAGIEARHTDYLSQILDEEAFIQGVFDDIRAELTKRIRAGEEVPAYKIIQGPGRREWLLDDEELRKKFKGMALPMTEYEVTKMGSPAHVEKSERLKDKQKTNLKKFYKTTPGKEKLVIATASGKEVVYDSAKAFEKAEAVAAPTQPEPYNFL